MVKSQNRTIGVIAILIMLGTSPLSVTYSFADIDSQNGFRVILTEKVVNGELKVQHYSLPDDYTREDSHRILSLDDKVSSWVFVNYNAYNSGIILFDGKVYKVGERQLELELSGVSNNSHTIMHETTSNEDPSYRVIFSGKISEIDEKSMYAISFMSSSLKNPDMGQNIKFLQIGELSPISEKLIDSNQEFKNSISV